VEQDPGLSIGQPQQSRAITEVTIRSAKAHNTDDR